MYSVGLSTCKEGRQPHLVVCVDVCSVFFFFSMSSVPGTVSKAGFGAFRPLCMCYVSVVRSVVVECMALKPC